MSTNDNDENKNEEQEPGMEYNNATDDDDAELNDNDDKESDGSSSFGFCGVDLDDLSDGEDVDFDDDEIERPGKTYEYVNFVDPKYAEKRKSRSYTHTYSSQNQFSSHSSMGGVSTPTEDTKITHSPFMIEHQSSTRSVPSRLQSRTNLTASSHPHLAISVSGGTTYSQARLSAKSYTSNLSKNRLLSARSLISQSSVASLHSGTQSSRMSAYLRTPNTPGTIPEEEEDGDQPDPASYHISTESFLNHPEDKIVDIHPVSPAVSPDIMSLSDTHSVHGRYSIVSNGLSMDGSHGHIHTHSIHQHENSSHR